MFLNADDMEIEVDLSNQQIIMAGPKIINFEIDESRKKKLLEGLDEIGITLQFDSQITEYEKRNSKFIASHN
jgi:3-isopropylmalate/(R)-2-methylmalate dehydratase small subunit